MMNITYEIEFFSDWHCGSGLSSGVDLDLLVIKDENGLPYVPGKTIKGLLKEAVEELNRFSGKENSLIRQAFGYSLSKKDKQNSNKEEDNTDKSETGDCFFTNAELDDKLREKIISANLSKYFYSSISSTAIEETGVAKENSLRRMEVTIPCKLYGEIKDIPDELKPEIIKGLKFIKRLGQNRNRGLGRCVFSIKKGGKI